MPRFRKHQAFGVAAAAAALAAGPALAHHSFAMFQFDKPTVMDGTVKELDWTNPHVALLVVHEGKAAAPAELWTFELSSPGNLTRAGWDKHTFQPGDKIKITYFPLRDGQHGGFFETATVAATGKVVTNGRKEALAVK